MSRTVYTSQVKVLNPRANELLIHEIRDGKSAITGERQVTRASVPLSVTAVAGDSASAPTPATNTATGTKVGSLVSGTSPGMNFLAGFQGKAVTQYFDNIVYQNGGTVLVSNPVGYAMIDKKNNMTLHYYLRDHEGNVRVVTNGFGNKGFLYPILLSARCLLKGDGAKSKMGLFFFVGEQVGNLVTCRL